MWLYCQSNLYEVYVQFDLKSLSNCPNGALLGFESPLQGLGVCWLDFPGRCPGLVGVNRAVGPGKNAAI